MIREITVPEIGENVESGVVVAIHIKVGDPIAVDDTIIELETDKALVEIPSPFAGRAIQILAEAGQEMKVGAVIARVEVAEADQPTQGVGDDASAPDAEAPATTDTGKPHPAETAARRPQPAAKAAPTHTADSESGKDAAPGIRPIPASPSIRRLARELGVDLHGVTGSGRGGRITEADVKAHVRQRQSATVTGLGSGPMGPPQPLPDFGRWGEVENLEMETVRRLTAQSTATSWAAIPHVTQFDEADITGVLAFIQKHAKTAETAGTKVTMTAVVTFVCARALRRFPHFNASIDVAANRIILKRYVHIGIAVNTPRGLLVPVVRDADQKTIVDSAMAIADLAERARAKKIKPDEMEGGTFTISNQGGIGGVGFTPIVMWPQVAILGMSRSAIKPVYIENRFEARTMLPLSLSYDHRIIDGADAARFLRWICDGLENPMTLFFD